MVLETQQQAEQSTESRLVLPANFLANCAFAWAAYHIALWHILFIVNYLQQSAPTLGVWEFYLHFATQAYPLALTAVATTPLLLRAISRSADTISAPLRRVEETLKKLRLGEPVQPVQFRHDDALNRLQDELNAFVEWYEETNRLDATSPEESADYTERSVLKRLADLKKTTQGIRAVGEKLPRRPHLMSPPDGR